MKKINERYHVQVAMNEKDYQMLRKLAYDRQLTCNETLRVLVRESSRKTVKKE